MINQWKEQESDLLRKSKPDHGEIDTTIHKMRELYVL